MRVSQSVFDDARRKIAEKKAKREEKRATLPWGKVVGPMPSARVWPSSVSAKVYTNVADVQRDFGTKPKKKSPSLWKWWAAKLDALWSVYIKRRDVKSYGNVCRVMKSANCTGTAQVAYHIAPKSLGYAARWNPDNGVAACSACNDGERKNRALYRLHHEIIFGKVLVDNMHALTKTIGKYDVPMLKAMCADFVEKIKGLQKI